MSANDLLSDIEQYLEAEGMSPSGFGRAAMSDPGFVFRLRDGGECFSRTARKVRGWMAENRTNGEASTVEATE